MESFAFVFIIAGAAVVILVPAIWWIATSNGFKRKSIKISEALSGIEVALTKRCDMLTKMLDIAKSYTKHEKELFTQVIELRRGMTVSEINEKNAQLDAMSARISAVAESYPQLQSAGVFRDLQTGVRDAEEHLQAARRLYNSNVSAFNTAVEIFPASIVANAQHIKKEHTFFMAEAAKREDVQMRF
jgi:LemA protein